MKSQLSANRRLLLFTAGFAAFAASSPKSPTCECERPPGGTIRCEAGQIPSCSVRVDRSVDGRCMNPPAQLRGDALRAWILSEVLRRRVTQEDLTKPEFRNAIATEAATLSDGTRVRFHIPRELK